MGVIVLESESVEAIHVDVFEKVVGDVFVHAVFLARTVDVLAVELLDSLFLLQQTKVDLIERLQGRHYIIYYTLTSIV